MYYSIFSFFLWLTVKLVMTVSFQQDMYGWPDEPFEEMDSTLAVQQVTEELWIIFLFPQSTKGSLLTEASFLGI